MLPLTWHSPSCSGAAASQAKYLKQDKVRLFNEQPGCVFTPVDVETSGVLGPLSLIFLKELGHRVSVTTGDTKSYTSLLQRLSVAVQRGKVASIRGTLPSFADLYST